MSSLLRLVFGVFLLIGVCSAISIVLPGQRLEENLLPDLSDTCLGCICEATSNCNMTIGCTRGLCGPFLISKPYWIDAGRPVLLHDRPDSEFAYVSCVNDPFCAARTVRLYMERFAQDCNKDRKLDCDDYARIHYLGGYQCALPMDNYMYYDVFRQCREVTRWLNG